MKKLVCFALSCLVYLAVPVAVSAQEEIDASVDKDAAREERRARMEECIPSALVGHNPLIA